METMREAWTDERLDDLRADVNRGFGELREEMRREFGRVDTDIRELRAEMGQMNARFDALQRTMVIGFAAIGGGVLASVAATVLAAVLG